MTIDSPRLARLLLAEDLFGCAMGGELSTDDILTREDADENDEDEPEPIDLLIEQAQKKTVSAINQWVKIIGGWLQQQSSLEAARDTLRDEIVPLFEQLPNRKFADALAEAMLLADLAGQVEALDDISRMDSLSDSLPRLDAPTPPWLKLPFKEAIDAFRKRLVIPLANYRAMDDSYHEWAFSIAGITRADILEDAKWLIGQAITEGNSFETFQKQWKRLIGRKGWNPGERRLYTIFDTNLRASHHQGRAKQILDPEVKSRRPLLLWRWRDSPNPRVDHQSLHNKAIPVDHPFWQKCSFPAGWGCRCTAFSVTEEYCKRKGIEILSNPPDPDLIAEEGFRRPFAGMDEAQRKEALSEMKKRVDPKLRDKI